MKVEFKPYEKFTHLIRKAQKVNHSALQVQSLILRHECLMYVLT
ncbi:hypothetical protein [Candidatus Tisiphia endosymbiont of Parasteatoda lunata]